MRPLTTLMILASALLFALGVTLLRGPGVMTVVIGIAMIIHSIAMLQSILTYVRNRNGKIHN